MRRLSGKPSNAIRAAVPLAAALCALAILRAAAPGYLTRQGFPLDDAWIHAVYAREFARTATLAYNPGVPATGETSPLWALVTAIPHLFAHGDRAIAATKILGFALHAVSAVLIAIALGAASPQSKGLATAAGALAAFHPDLVAAAVSGMEVPLATCVVAGVAYATARESIALAAVCAAAAFLARPETALIAVLCPMVFFVNAGARRWLGMTLAASGGSFAALGVLAVRNLVVSGRPLPATFYAKAATSWSHALAWQQTGFARVFEAMPVVAAPALLVVIALGSAWVVTRERVEPASRLAATLALCGLAFCVASFALVHPVDPQAFYHQRYVLPALLPLTAAAPFLVRELAGAVRVRPRAAAAILVAILAAWMAYAAPARFRRLSNDARNIDDVQVAFGKALSETSASDVVWVVDAGAIRYYGAPLVVDLMALNTFELLGPGAQQFLDRHPPRYLDVFGGWSSVKTEGEDDLVSRSFVASTAYTVTGFPEMRQHTLVVCRPAGRRGVIDVRGRAFSFRCGAGD